MIIVGLFYLLQISGLQNMMVPDRLAETGMGYGMLFVVGLITSVHCVAMCGGIGLSFSKAIVQSHNGTICCESEPGVISL